MCIFSTKRCLLQGIMGLLLVVPLYAGMPVWTFLPLTDTLLIITSSETATIQYQVTNQSRKPHTLVMTSIPGITQLTTVGNCPNPFTLSYQQSCTLTLEVSGSALQSKVLGGPKVCQQGNHLQCYQPSSDNSLNITLSQAPGETMLSASVSDLALSVTGLEDAPSGFSGTSGTPRKITIRNTGDAPAVNTVITYPTWPTGTTVSSTCTSTLAAGGACEITVIPGNTATDNASTASCATTTPGSAPVPGVIEVRADNASSVSTNVVVLGYGCIYQGGYLFSIDETADVSQSIGGAVVFTTDQDAPSTLFAWRSSGSGVQGASSITDGASNTNILANASGTYPAAATCIALTSAGFSDWYLPAICELGYEQSDSSGCGSAASPLIQNVRSNLGLSAGKGGFADDDDYWSSTEFDANNAWSQYFGNGDQGGTSKVFPILVRCARAF